MLFLCMYFYYAPSKLSFVQGFVISETLQHIIQIGLDITRGREWRSLCFSAVHELVLLVNQVWALVDRFGVQLGPDFLCALLILAFDAICNRDVIDDLEAPVSANNLFAHFLRVIETKCARLHLNA